MKTLPDYINSEVRVLFVGINPGIRSATVSHHFAGYSNRFWKLLSDSKLVPLPLTYHDDWRLPQWGLGLTNMVARPTSGSKDLTPRDYQRGRARLKAKIRKHRVALLALLGVTLYPVLFTQAPNRGSQVGKDHVNPKLGFQSRTFAGAKVFVLPNPSGRNAHYSYTDMLKIFKKLASEVRKEKCEGNTARMC